MSPTLPGMFGCLTLMAGFVLAAEGIATRPLTKEDRIVFLGDSITDGFTYPLMVQQALADAKLPAPTIINAGVASDTAAQMLARLEETVLAEKPTIVTLSAGANDIFRGVTPEAYAKTVTAIADKLKEKNIELVILTTTILGPKHPEKDKALEDYNVFLRTFAHERGLRVGDVRKVMQEARAAGHDDLIMPDHVHITLPGYERMARAVLDGLGYAEVPVPKTLKLAPYPGLVDKWQVRAVAKDAVLNEESVKNLATDDSWKAYTLPDPKPLEDNNWWFDHERQRGASVTLERLLGKSPRYQGMAALDEPKARKARILVGADVQAVWLNGKCVYKASTWHGWHCGREKVTVDLNAGKNAIILESGPVFILCVEDLPE